MFITIVVLTASVIINAVSRAGANPWYVCAPFAAAFTALWCYGAIHHRSGRWPEFGALARHLGALGICGMTYVLTFHEPAETMPFSGALQSTTRDGYFWAMAVPLGLTAVFLVAGSIAARRARNAAVLSGLWFPVGVFTALFLVTLLPDPELYGTIGFNAVAAALALYGIVVGLRDYNRLPYWSGLGLLVILITSRFFEYESHLLVKSLGFLGAGVIMIVAGIRFENRLRRKEADA